MNILIVSATQFEVKPLLDFLKIENTVMGMNMPMKQMNELDIHVLITGIGMVNTAFMLGRHASLHFDLVINVGVCGAFNRNLELGQLVNITSDLLSEMGAEDGDEFLTYNQLNLPGEYAFSNKLSSNFLYFDNLPKVTGITVNTIHGNDLSIDKIKQLYEPDVESMEGAAFFATLKNAGKNIRQIKYENKRTAISVPQSANYIQIRAISNYVEKRDKSKWQMGLAIKNLNDFIINFIETI